MAEAAETSVTVTLSSEESSDSEADDTLLASIKTTSESDLPGGGVSDKTTSTGPQTQSTSLLSRLRAPQQAEIERKRAVYRNNYGNR